MDEFREPVQLPGVPRRTTDVLQFENSPDDLDDGVLSIICSRTVVEPGAIEIVGSNWTVGVHARWIGEVDRLQKIS